MGCVWSGVEKEESVRRSKERKKLMKQLVICRCEMAVTHLAYLQSLRNTGATLRQFVEDDYVVPGAMLPRSPLPLPPSPPPPPPFSPDSRKDEEEVDGEEKEELRRDDGAERLVLENLSLEGEESNENCGESLGSSSLPPPVPSSGWDFWDPFDPPTIPTQSSPVRRRSEVEVVEEENWAETNTEFVEEEEAEVVQEVVDAGVGAVEKKATGTVRVDFVVDDNSSAMSWLTKDSDMAMVVWRSKKTLAGIMKDLDDYFLKASAGGTEVMAFLEMNKSSCLLPNSANKGKNGKSAKVFSSLSWRWSSRSLLSTRDAFELQASEACRSVSHCMTLDKLYAEEQRLYKEVKEEEATKKKLKGKTLLLEKQEAMEEDSMKLEKTRLSVDELQSQIRSMQESINTTCLCISNLRDEELYPQLIDLCSSLMQMWRIMYECHQVQNHIAQQANHLHNHPSNEPTTDSHCHATAQLKTEVTSWHNAFHKLLKSQREYAHILNQWVRLTDCLPDNDDQTGSSSRVHTLCEEWQQAIDRLPEKAAAEAIKSFISVIHSIDLQLTEERKLQKKSERLEKRLEKALNLLNDMETRCSENSIDGTITTALASNLNTPTRKQMKLASLKKRAGEENAKHLNSIRTSQAMTLNNLQTSLPNVFQAMTGFAGLCVQAFEGVHRCSEATTATTRVA